MSQILPIETRMLETVKAGPYLVVCINSLRPFEPPARVSLRRAHRVELRRSTRRSVVRDVVDGKRVCQIRVADKTASALHAFISQDAPGDFRLWDCDSKNGTVLNGSPVSGQARLGDGDLIRVGSTFFVFRSGDSEPPSFADSESLVCPIATLVPSLAAAFARAKGWSKQDGGILVEGGPGSARAVVARWLHEASGRAGPFVRVPCPRLLDEIQLMRRADGGTLFLDGLEGLDTNSKAILDSLLDGSHWQPTRGKSLEVRVVSAAAPGHVQTLAPSLRARLAKNCFQLPLLSERREDFGFLIARELLSAGATVKVSLDRDAVSALLHHSWPENENELASAIRHAVSIATVDGRHIKLVHLPRTIRDVAVQQGGLERAAGR